MSLQLSYTIPLIASAFFLAWTGFKLVEKENTTHEGLGLFLLLMAFLHITLSLASSVEVALIAHPADSLLITIFRYAYTSIITTTSVTFIYFVLRVMIMPMVAANKKRRFKID